MAVRTQHQGTVYTVTISRPQRRNAVDRDTASELTAAFREFDDNPNCHVAVLCGDGGNFCAGADLKAVAAGQGNKVSDEGDGPMGPTRLVLRKPVIAAVTGYAVAGGLELALWCDMRVVDRTAVFGVYCRRWGVPLIDGGTVRLPRVVGMGRAMDMILTGRPVDAQEAYRMGLADRLVEEGEALATAQDLAKTLSGFPQACLRADRLSAYEQWGREMDDAIRNECRRGMKVIASGETAAGAARFLAGAGRHGEFET